MIKFSFFVRLRHWFIISRWQKWLFPVICCVPYLVILVWLLTRSLFWVAQVLLAPLLMAAVLAALTLWLARQEFRTKLPGRRILPRTD